VVVAALAGGASGVAGSALLPARPAVERAEVLLYDGQPTPLGQVLVIAQVEDGDVALLRLQRVLADASAAPAPECPGDLTRDGVVNFADLNEALHAPAFSMRDLNLVLSAFGQSCD